jgi:predicted phosphodiesterase
MIGILSDAHGNYGAFHTAIFHLSRLGAKKFYFLGDAVGYVPSIEVVEALHFMGSDVKCILGNHEIMMLQGGQTPSRELIYQHQQLREKLSIPQIEFMKSWPTHRRDQINGIAVLFVHGSPADFSNGYVYPNTDLNQFKPNSSFVFMGHSHYPFVRTTNDTTFVNVGSCGLPRDDGRFGAACLFDPKSSTVKIIRFDITDKTESLLAANTSVHESVHAVFARRNCSIFGEFL